MIRQAVMVLLMIALLAACGCGSSSTAQQQPPTENPSPTPSAGTVWITSLSPSSAVARSPDLTLAITGSNFPHSGDNFAQAIWSANGRNTVLATTSLADTQLTAVIPAPLMTAPITVQVFLEYGDRMGDVPLK